MLIFPVVVEEPTAVESLNIRQLYYHNANFSSRTASARSHFTVKLLQRSSHLHSSLGKDAMKLLSKK